MAGVPVAAPAAVNVPGSNSVSIKRAVGHFVSIPGCMDTFSILPRFNRGQGTIISNIRNNCTLTPLYHYYMTMSEPTTNSTCGVPGVPDLAGITQVQLHPEPTPDDYRLAMQLADAEAEARLGEYMLLSWYDRDRDFESPQHASECHQDSATPGYVDYGVNHGARLMVDIEAGRFVFFYMPVEL